MKLVGVEELALVLTGIRIVASNVDRCERSSRSARDLIIDARIIISKRESSSKPSPLKSPSAIRKIRGNGECSLARLKRAISWSTVSAIRIRRVVRLASSNLVTIDLLNIAIEHAHGIGLSSRSPSKSNKSTSVIVSWPLYSDLLSSRSGNRSSSLLSKGNVARSKARRSSAASLSLFLIASARGTGDVRVCESSIKKS